MSEKGDGRRSGAGQLIRRVLVAAGGVVSGLTLAGFASGLWWPLELVCHFRMQYLVALAVIALALVLLRMARAAGVFAAFCAVNLALIVPFYVAPAGGGSSVPLRAMMINVHTANRGAGVVKAATRKYNPDFLLLLEVDAWWLLALDDLSDAYPYSIKQPRPDNFGIALFSKVPFVKAEIVSIGAAGVPSVAAEVLFDGRPFMVFGTHPLPPVGADYARLRNEQFVVIAEFVRQIDSPVLLLGDLNITQWSHFFDRLLEEAGLHDSSPGHGFQPTWPVHNVLLRIPIDHCLHSDGIKIVDRQVGPDVGSDHYPLIVDFAVSRR